VLTLTHHLMRSLSALSFLLLIAATPAAMPAQAPLASPATATISVSAEGIVSVTPDQASIRLSVVTRAPTAREAGAANARKQRAVIDALLGLNIPKERIGTSGFRLQPEMRYAPNVAPEVIGYTASNTVTVELKSIDAVGAAIDAALKQGANEVSGLSFSFSGAAGARRDAITKAVQIARRDAEAAAQGAGQVLGALLSIDVSAESSPRPMMYDAGPASAMAAVAPRTPVEAGTQEIRVTVSTRWAVR
jgi:uncharacterized protein YggE